MIGVFLESKSNEIVTEFFELFKTPWEFYKNDVFYDVIITDDNDFSIFDSNLIIFFNSSSKFNSTTRNNYPLFVSTSNGTTFPLYNSINLISDGDPIITVNDTGESVAVRKIKNGKTVIELGFNFFSEIQYLLEIGQPIITGHIPTLDIHISNLKEWLLNEGITFFEIPPLPFGSKFFVCLTHDVDFAGIKNHFLDRTFFGFIYRALIKSMFNFLRNRLPLKYLIRNYLTVFTLPFIFAEIFKDIWFQFDNYRKIENPFKSTYFFVPFKNCRGENGFHKIPNSRSVKYDVSLLKDEILNLLNDGFEVGVHGIDSWLDHKIAKQELNRISFLSNKNDLGIRMHWLLFGKDSLLHLDKAGYKYDSSLGYNEIAGFRSGTSQVFKPLSVKKLLELPLHIMDTSLFYPDRMNLSFSDGISTIKRFIAYSAKNGGVITINWHHRSIAPERLWRDVYIEAIKLFNSSGAKFLNAKSVVDWFEKRRNITFSSIRKTDSHITINLSYNKDIYPLDSDNFMIRFYSPSSDSALSNNVIDLQNNYSDYEISDQNSVKIHLS